MRTMKNYLLGAGLLFALSVPVLAQETADAVKQPQISGQTADSAGKAAKGQGKARKGRGISMGILPVSAIDFAVGLKDDQKPKIEAIQDKLKEDEKAAGGDQVKMKEIGTKANEELLAILTSEQKAALTKATPMLGMLVRTKAIPMGVLGDLKLTADQKSKIEEAAAETQGKMRGARGDKAAQQEFQSAFKTKVEGILTDDQKKMIAEHPDKMTKKVKKTKKP